jgi:xanthine dehydrogenase small subunit
MEQALKIMNEEISPISDARGTSNYKRLLLRQLVMAHMMKFFGPVEALKNILLQ